jgi:hypothetical protein
MSNRIFIMLYLVFANLGIAKAIENECLTSKDTIKIISGIKRQYLEINSNLSKYIKIEKKILGKSTEGGIIVIYHEKSIIKKIVITLYGEMGKNISEYYYKDSLVFVLRSEYLYDKPIYYKGSHVVSIDENRYYFFNDTLIKWINKERRIINPNSLLFKDEERIVLKEAREVLNTNKLD